MHVFSDVLFKEQFKGRFTRYDFAARDKFTTGLRHVLGPFTRERHFHFTYKIKYAKVCTGIYGAKFLTNGKKNTSAVLRIEKAF